MRLTRVLHLGIVLLGLLIFSESQASLLMTQACSMPLSGSYTINSGAVTSGTNYTNFTDAITDLTTCGISGAVTFTVASGSGPYTEQITMPAITGSSATNTITFDGNGETLQFAPSIDTMKWIWQMNGADYVTIRDLTIVSNGIYGWGIHLFNSANHVTVDQCTIDMSAVPFTWLANIRPYGIIATNSFIDQGAPGDNAQSFSLTNSTINAVHGVRHVGGEFDIQSNCRFENNVFQDFSRVGISLRYHEQATIHGNDMSGSYAVWDTNGTITCIDLLDCFGGNVISANRIHGISGRSISNDTYGILMDFSNGTLGNENLIVNNVFYDLNAPGSIQCVSNTNSSYLKVYHNTFFLDNYNPVDPSRNILAFSTFDFVGVPVVGIEFVNNIISMPGSNKFGVVGFAASSISMIADHNNYYLNSPNSRLGYWDGVEIFDLATWQTVNGGAFGANSSALDPVFVDPASGNFAPTNSLMNDLGDNLGIAVDINNIARGTNPDMGAWEFGSSCTPVYDSLNITSCDSYVSPSGNNTWTSTGLYFDTLMDGSGCDTIVVVDLVINTNCPPNTMICSATDILVSKYPFRSSSLNCITNVGSNFGALPEPQGDPNTICGALNGVSVWYTFVSPSCEDLNISAFDITLSTDNPQTDFNTVIRVFESDNDSCDGNFTEVVCALDGTPNGCVGGGVAGNSNLDISATLDPGRRYFVMIDGESGATGTYELSLSVKPDAPTLVAGSAPETQVQVTWPDVNASQYHLYWSPLGSTGYNIATTNSPHLLSNLQSGETYEVWVGNACDGTSSDFYWSPTDTITTAPTSCTGPTITCGTTTANSIELVWTPVVDASSYHIWYQVVGSAGYNVVWNQSGPSYTITGLQPNTNYKIWMASVCPGPVAKFSADLFCTTSGAGSKPENDGVSDGLFTFEFDGIKYVEYKMSDIPLIGLEEMGDGYFEIVDGELVQFDPENNEVAEAVQVAAQHPFEVNVSPNPITTDQTTVALDMYLEEEKDIQVYLYDMNGRFVFTVQLGRFQYHMNETVQLGRLESGVYQLAIYADAETYVEKIVVLK